MLLYQNLAFIIHSHKKIINLKYQLLHGMRSFNYLMDLILYQLFKLTLNRSLKKHETVTDNCSTKIYIDKIEKRIKTGYNF